MKTCEYSGALAGAGEITRSSFFRMTILAVAGLLAGTSYADGSIRGHVYESDAVTPIPSGFVNVYDAEGWNHLQNAEIDVNGDYVITGLPAGDYKVEVQGMPLGFAPEFYDGQPDFRSADVLSLGAEQTLMNIDFTVEPGGAICGYVYETNGVTPIAEENVMVWPDGGGDGTGTLTDSNGYFYIALPVGNWTAMAGGRQGYIDEYYQEAEGEDGAQLVQVTVGTITSNINFSLELGGSISGHVYESDGTTPVSSGRVHVLASEGWEYVKGSEVETNGSFSITGLRAGDYKVQVDDLPLGFAPEYYDGESDYEWADVISLGVEEHQTGIDFTLEPGGAICGYVYETNGVTPIEDENVYVWEQGNPYGGFGMHSDENGYFYISLPTGDWLVSAGGNLGYVSEYYQESPDEDEAQAVHVSEGVLSSNINFTLEMGGAISGYVYEDDGTTPVTSGEISVLELSDRNFVAWTQIAGDGHYEAAGIPSGSYKVQIYNVPVGFVPQFYNGQLDYDEADAVAVTAGQTTSNINFILQPGGTICGYLLDTNANPIADENVRASLVEDDEIGFGDSTDSEGFFSIQLPSGSYKVEAGGWRIEEYVEEYYDNTYFRDNAEVVIVSAGQTVSNINFTLEAPSRIVGHVFESDGTTPVVDEDVWAYSTNTIPAEHYRFAERATDENGVYVLYLPAGTYHVFCADQCFDGVTHISNATPVTVGPVGTASNIDFTLTPAAFGQLLVDVEPDNATWHVETPLGEQFFIQGDIFTGNDEEEPGVFTGRYTVTWHDLAGWSLPTNQPAFTDIMEGQTGVVVGAYIPLDSDDDGMYDWEEWVAGTSSSNATDFFKIDTISAAPGADQVIQWDGVAGRVYRIYCATNLLDTSPWTDTGVSVTSLVSRPLTFTNQITSSLRFYCLGVEQP